MPGFQEEVDRAVIAVGQPVIAVLVKGRPLSIPWMEEHAAAVLEIWLPEKKGTAAVAKVWLGAASLGGKLTVPISRPVGLLPMEYNCAPSGGSSNWYKDHADLPVNPRYAF